MLLILLCTLMGFVFCDTPADCRFDDTVGKWTLHLSAANQTNTIDCDHPEFVSLLRVELVFPNKVVDDFGNVGTWTMVYNQGFEITLNGRRYFAFQYYYTNDTGVISSCGQTFNGWVHDSVKKNIYPPVNWGCYRGEKENSSVKFRAHKKALFNDMLHQPYGLKHEFVKEINDKQSLWKAGIYERYDNFTLADLIQRAGGKKNLGNIKARANIQDIWGLPEVFDWRNKSGTDFVSPIRNQGNCGSCYAFASMGQLEASARIETNGRIQPVFSTQNIVSCSNYSQGCEGGFPYLIAGMYGQDFGVITEDCYPYVGNDTECHPLTPGGYRIYVSDYGYVGGFYGGCSEVLMKQALVQYGPLSVGINVTSEFVHYKGGIFYQTGARLPDDLKYDPFQLTNHAVLVVGYGVDHDSGVKYWVVKNSWGKDWGEDGFFRILRGTDELAIESLAVYAKVYFGH